ncbi:MAG: hypothetical protein AAF593_14990 [Planctomycetota bacterium]
MAPDWPVMRRAEYLEILCDQGPFPSPGDSAAVTVGGRYTRDAVRAYAESGAVVQTLVDWPSGLGKPTVRQIEAVAAAKDGTATVQVMAHPAHVVGRHDAALREDIMGLVIAVREVSREIGVDVVIEASWLSGDVAYAESVGLAVRESGGDGVVVSPEGVSDELSRQLISTLSSTSGPTRVKVVSASASDEALDGWLDCGADRVIVPSGILFE